MPPNTFDSARRLQAISQTGLEYAKDHFDRERYPLWRDWLANPGGGRRRAAVTERLRATGVLDLPGADLGW